MHKAYRSSPIGPVAAVRCGISDRYYEEGEIIPEVSRSKPSTLIGVGPRLCGLPRTLFLQAKFVNKGKKRKTEAA
jgi:hypothetical protein